MRGAGLQAFYEEFIAGSASGDEDFSLGQMTHTQCDLQSDMFYKCGEHVLNEQIFQQIFLVGFEKLPT